VGSEADNHGYAAVSVDGGPSAIIDSYSPAEEYQQVLFSKSGLSTGRHTITITVLDQKDSASSGTYSDIDAFIVGSPG
jgi:galactosylceramidase